MLIAIDTIYVFLTTSKCSKVLRNAYTSHVHAAANGVFNSFSMIYIFFMGKDSTMYSIKKMKEFSLQVVCAVIKLE